jgi:hypothetical protein
MDGIIKVVPLGGAVAVVADHYWQARLGLAKLKIDWRPGRGGAFDDAALAAMYRQVMQGDAGWAEAEKHGDGLGGAGLRAARGRSRLRSALDRTLRWSR